MDLVLNSRFNFFMDVGETAAEASSSLVGLVGALGSISSRSSLLRCFRTTKKATAPNRPNINRVRTALPPLFMPESAALDRRPYFAVAHPGGCDPRTNSQCSPS